MLILYLCKCWSKPKLPSDQVVLDSGEDNNEGDEDDNKSDQDKGARKNKQARQGRDTSA